MKDRLKELRQKLGLTQAEFSERLGVSRTSVTAWEKDAEIPISRIFQICNEFHVSKEWLIFGNGDMFEQVDDKEVAIRNFVEIATEIYESLPDDKKEIVLALIKRLAR